MHSNISSILAELSGSTARHLPVCSTLNAPFKDALEETITSKIKRDQDIRVTERRRERNYMLEAARADPFEAQKLAYGYAHNALSSPLLDLSDRPNVRYASTGVLVTTESQRYFTIISQAMQRRCSDLYQQEISRRTPRQKYWRKYSSLETRRRI